MEQAAGQSPNSQVKDWRAPQWPLRLTPLRVVVLLAGLVFVAEFLVMLLLSNLPPMSREIRAVLDSCILLIFLSPAYFIFYLPLRKHYQEHQQADAEVHFLSRQLLTIVEEEKKRIALDLHDACGQTLAALQYKLGAFGSAMPADLSREQQAQFDQVNELVHQLSNHIRNLTSSLRPVMLEHLGLAASLEWHISVLADQWPHVRMEFAHDHFSGLLRPEIEIAMFRICQEALNNVLRHAEAQRVRVTLERTAGWIRLRIEDDGRGFEPGQSQDGKGRIEGIGLLGMRERIESLGGRLRVETNLGAGTMVMAEIPEEEGSDEHSTN